MKTILKFVLILLIGFSASVAMANKTDEAIEVVDSKYKNLFVFRTEKKFIGAKVEVVYSNGDVITTQTLEKKKMIINFCDVKFGTYTIRVTKGNKVKEFQYVKK